MRHTLAIKSPAHARERMHAALCENALPPVEPSLAHTTSCESELGGRQGGSLTSFTNATCEPQKPDGSHMKCRNPTSSTSSHPHPYTSHPHMNGRNPTSSTSQLPEPHMIHMHRITSPATSLDPPPPTSRPPASWLILIRLHGVAPRGWPSVRSPEQFHPGAYHCS